jgi:hypothetical protein
MGRTLGVTIIRTLGPAAGDKLMATANAIVAAPPKGEQYLKIGDELLLGLAASGNPKAVEYLLDIFHMKRGDDTLADRALGALYKAYVDPGGLFAAADPAALAGSVGRLAEIAKDESYSAHFANDALALIRTVGAPACFDPLLSMVSHPHSNSQFRFVAAINAWSCGGLTKLEPVATALPTDQPYDHEVLVNSIVKPGVKLGARDQVAAAARPLLSSKSWVARWLAVELLGELKSKADAGAVKALAGDRTKLVGYWGDQDDLPKAERKAELTLGERAAAVGKELDAAGG